MTHLIYLVGFCHPDNNHDVTLCGIKRSQWTHATRVCGTHVAKAHMDSYGLEVCSACLDAWGTPGVAPAVIPPPPEIDCEQLALFLTDGVPA